MGTTPSDSADQLRSDAAKLAFAMLRFAAGAAHPDRSATPRGMLHLSTECYSFTPSWQRIPIADVPGFLATLPSAALLTSTTTRGIATLTLVDELQGERRAWADKILGNQQAGLEQLTRQLNLGADGHVLLQFDEDELWFPLAVLRESLARYGVDIGWNIRSYEDDERAQARLMLFRSDGAHSWGDACPVRERD